MSAVSLGWNSGREIMGTKFLCDQDMFIKYQKFGMELTAFHLLSLVCTFPKTYRQHFLYSIIMCSSNCSASKDYLQLFRILADIMSGCLLSVCQSTFLPPSTKFSCLKMLKHNHLSRFKVGKNFTEASLHCKYDGSKKVKQIHRFLWWWLWWLTWIYICSLDELDFCVTFC